MKNGVLPLLMVMCLMLSACGFRPMYGSYSAPAETGGTVTAALNKITIGNIPEREGQILRNNLIDRFYEDGYPGQPRYSLQVENLNEVLRDMDITTRSDTTRRQMRISARLVLNDMETGEPVFTRDIVSTGSYNVLASQYTTRVSRQNVRENILKDMAMQIERQIALFLNNQT